MTQYDETAAEGLGATGAEGSLFVTLTTAEGLGIDETGPIGGLSILTPEGLGFTGTGLYEHAMVIAEALGATDTSVSKLTARITVAEELSHADAITVAFNALAAEGVGGTDAAVGLPQKIGRVAEQLQMAGVATANHHANKLIAEALALADVLSRGIGATAAEALGATGALADLVKFYQTITEEAGLNDDLAYAQRLYVVTDENIGQADWVSPNQVLREAIAEGVSLGGLMLSLDSTGTAWVINTNSVGVSEYNNFGFNSFAKHGQRFLAASDSAIFELTGDDDTGTDIATQLRTGLSQFGVSQKKRISDLYIGYKSDGALVLKAVYNMDNEQREAWYKLTDTSNAHDNARFKIGKGAKAVYWAFELVNKDGADFELDKVQMHVVPLDRRL